VVRTPTSKTRGYLSMYLPSPDRLSDTTAENRQPQNSTALKPTPDLLKALKACTAP
jgi:hypothetical protein